MHSAGLLFALCVAVAAAAPAEQAPPAIPAAMVESVKMQMSKGLFEDLAQVSQSIIEHAQMLAQKIIMSIDDAAKKALESLNRDKPHVAGAIPTAVAVEAEPAHVSETPVKDVPVVMSEDSLNAVKMEVLVTPILKDAPVAMDASVTPILKDVPVAKDASVTPILMDVPVAKDASVTLILMDVPVAKDASVTPILMDVPVAKDASATPVASIMKEGSIKSSS